MGRFRPGTLLMALGGGLMAAALALLVYTAWEDHRASADAQGLVVELSAAVAERAADEAPGDIPADDTGDAHIAHTADELRPLPDYVLYPEKEMPQVELDGYACVGLLELPTLERTLPVLADCTDAGLKHAPCRYSGSAYLQNMVIAGHNYTSHFARLGSLLPGDPVYFTDGDGNRFCYQVSDLETLSPTDIGEMTSGDWALTLFTCTYGNRSRLAVRCILSEDS